MNRVFLKPLALSLFVGAAFAAQADVILNTFGITGTGFDSGTGWSVNNSQYMGRAFNMPGSYTLDQIDVALFGNPGDVVNVNIHSDNAGAPGAVLETLSVAVSDVSTNYSLISVLHPLMTSGTYYLTLAPANPSGAAAWCWTNDSHTADLLFSTDQGGVYNQFNNVDVATTVYGTLVPEPASFAVLGLGALALVRRRRANK